MKEQVFCFLLNMTCSETIYLICSNIEKYLKKKNYVPVSLKDDIIQWEAMINGSLFIDPPTSN